MPSIRQKAEELGISLPDQASLEVLAGGGKVCRLPDLESSMLNCACTGLCSLHTCLHDLDNSSVALLLWCAGTAKDAIRCVVPSPGELTFYVAVGLCGACCVVEGDWLMRQKPLKHMQ